LKLSTATDRRRSIVLRRLFFVEIGEKQIVASKQLRVVLQYLLEHAFLTDLSGGSFQK